MLKLLTVFAKSFIVDIWKWFQIHLYDYCIQTSYPKISDILSWCLLLIKVSQETFTCSNSTIETLPNMLKVSNKNTRTTFRTSFCCLYCLLWRYLVPFSTLSIVNFEQVNVCWDRNRRVSIRSSHRRCSVTKGVLRNFAKLTRQHLCQRLFFNEVEGLLSYFLLRPACNFFKKESLARVFSCEFSEISKSMFIIEHLRTTASGVFILTNWIV